PDPASPSYRSGRVVPNQPARFFADPHSHAPMPARLIENPTRLPSAASPPLNPAARPRLNPGNSRKTGADRKRLIPRPEPAADGKKPGDSQCQPRHDDAAQDDRL